MSEIEFELVPEERAIIEKAKRRSKYDPIIDAFDFSTEETVRVEAKEIEASTLVYGLRGRLKQRGLTYTVSQRGNKVYLLKK